MDNPSLGNSRHVVKETKLFQMTILKIGFQSINFISNSKTTKREKSIHFVFMEKCNHLNRLHADASYKLVWQGFPCLIIDPTDMNRHFHSHGFA